MYFPFRRRTLGLVVSRGWGWSFGSFDHGALAGAVCMLAMTAHRQATKEERLFRDYSSFRVTKEFSRSPLTHNAKYINNHGGRPSGTLPRSPIFVAIILTPQLQVASNLLIVTAQRRGSNNNSDIILAYLSSGHVTIVRSTSAIAVGL